MKWPNGTRHFYEFGHFRLDANRHQLLRDDQIIPLAPRAIETLLFLVQNAGKVLGREALMEAVWADTIVEDANLSVAIHQLRKALDHNGGPNEFIQTIPRIGYRFIADLHEAVEESAPPTVRSRIPLPNVTDGAISDKEISNGSPNRAAMPDDRPALVLNPPARPGKPFFSKATLLTVLGIAAVTVSAMALYRYSLTRSSVEPSMITSIAVLPLKNLTGDPNDEYLADGVTEGLINALSKLEGLKVISPGSVFTFKGKEIDPRRVGRQLGVMGIIEGGILKSKDSARVSVRLVSTEDGRVLWATDTFDRSLGDIFVIEDELARYRNRYHETKSREGSTRGDPHAHHEQFGGVPTLFEGPLFLEQANLGGPGSGDSLFRTSHQPRSKLRAGIFWLGRHVCDTQLL